MKATINKIAELAGVSTATVSRVMNNSSRVSQNTRDKVLAVVKEHNYEPSQAAIGLSQKKSNYIPIFLDSFDGYVSEYLNVACELIQQAGMFPVILKTQNEFILRQNVKKFDQMRPKFVVVLTQNTSTYLNISPNRVVKGHKSGNPAMDALDVRVMIKSIIN